MSQPETEKFWVSLFEIRSKRRKEKLLGYDTFQDSCMKQPVSLNLLESVDHLKFKDSVQLKC